MDLRNIFYKFASRQVIAGISILVLSISLAFYMAPSLVRQTPNTSTSPTYTGSSKHHFSVRWMGFLPTYNNSYPDYYVALNDAESDPLVLQIALQIKNQENRSFYFRIEQFSPPPSGWSVAPSNIGLIDMDQTVGFVYTVLRSRPTSIPTGAITEQISLAVKAFYDSYTTLYSQDNFTVNYHLLDISAPSWALLYHDNFDDGSKDGWDNGSPVNDYYRTFPYSLRFTGYFSKTFSVAGIYSEAYLIYSVRSEYWAGYNGQVHFDGVKLFSPDVSLQTNRWYEFAVPLKVNHNTSVQIWAEDAGQYAFLDDVFVVAK